MDSSQIWFAQAEEDLLWAEASLREEVWRGACFAAQQAAEKALKAFLLSKNELTPKIHDLVVLNEKCIGLDKDFKKIEEPCNVLSPFYISSRYPDVVQFEEYSGEIAKNAVQQAEKIIEFVKSKLH